MGAFGGGGLWAPVGVQASTPKLPVLGRPEEWDEDAKGLRGQVWWQMGVLLHRAVEKGERYEFSFAQFWMCVLRTKSPSSELLRPGFKR